MLEFWTLKFINVTVIYLMLCTNADFRAASKKSEVNTGKQFHRSKKYKWKNLLVKTSIAF